MVPDGYLVYRAVSTFINCEHELIDDLLTGNFPASSEVAYDIELGAMDLEPGVGTYGKNSLQLGPSRESNALLGSLRK